MAIAVVLRAAAPDRAAAIIELDPATGSWTALRQAMQTPLVLGGHRDPPSPSSSRRLAAGRAYGQFYPPTNRSFRGPAGDLPPLIVTSHGGPTAAAYTGLTVLAQLFASRGFAVLDVDYGGSTGYGKAYRKRLEGQWGVVDLDDCVDGAALRSSSRAWSTGSTWRSAVAARVATRRSAR